MGREPTAERRIEILETAVSLFLSQGYLRTSMQDVAETASVSKATLYQIFESKEGLGTEAVSLLTMRMLERVEAAAERNHPFSQDLLKQSIQIRMEQFAQRSRLTEEILFSIEEGQKEQPADRPMLYKSDHANLRAGERIDGGRTDLCSKRSAEGVYGGKRRGRAEAGRGRGLRSDYRLSGGSDGTAQG